MLCNVVIGKGRSKSSLVNYNVIAPTLIAACQIAQAKAREEFDEEEDWYDVLEAHIVSGSDPLRILLA